MLKFIAFGSIAAFGLAVLGLGFMVVTYLLEEMAARRKAAQEPPPPPRHDHDCLVEQCRFH